MLFFERYNKYYTVKTQPMGDGGVQKKMVKPFFLNTTR